VFSCHSFCLATVFASSVKKIVPSGTRKDGKESYTRNRRHREEWSDVAIHDRGGRDDVDCFARLAKTKRKVVSF